MYDKHTKYHLVRQYAAPSTFTSKLHVQQTLFVHAAILHVPIWRWGFLDHLARKTTTSTCTRTPILHVRKTSLTYMLPQFCMYAKHFFRTHTREAILHVRKTHLAYIHNCFNSSCTQNTAGLHTRDYQLVNQTKGPPHPPGGPPKLSSLTL